MAPFPESEDMTIKRLKVALKKNDYQLLKMGTYKLHEKFHTGYEFSMIEDLRAILEYVEGGNIPVEIKDILCSTIEEILSQKALKQLTEEDKVMPETSGLTELPSSLNNEITTGFKKIMPPKLEEVQAATPPQKVVPKSVYYETSRPQVTQETGQEKFEDKIKPIAEAKDIVVFYDDYKNDVDFSKVKDYKNHLNLLFSKNEDTQDYNILKQISSLTYVLDTDTKDIDRVVSMLATAKGKISFVTASQSQNISRILTEKNIDFEIPFVKKAKNKDAAIDLIPLAGSTNIFVCSNCNLRTLKTDFNTRTLSVQCPHCGGAAFPDIYAINSYNPDCNPVFWHRAFAACIKSQIWILLNPPLDENKEIFFDFIKTAFEAGAPKKVYILSKENDKKEFCKQTFTTINPKCEIRINFISEDKLCEEFINEEIIRKVFQ